MKNNYIVFFDFDNTITRFDIMDDMLLRLSQDKKWIELEKKWQRREIGSKECLEGQLRGIRITKVRLAGYLSKIRVDPYFRKLLKLFKLKKIKSLIVSDNFGFIIKEVLRNNGLLRLRVYCNRLRIAKDRLIPSFPFFSRDHKNCANCKKKILLTNKDKGFITVYVGDGLSDLCPARKADIVFAKSSLGRYLEKEGRSYIPIKGLKDVYDYFKSNLL